MFRISHPSFRTSLWKTSYLHCQHIKKLTVVFMKCCLCASGSESGECMRWQIWSGIEVAVRLSNPKHNLILARPKMQFGTSPMHSVYIHIQCFRIFDNYGTLNGVLSYLLRLIDANSAPVIYLIPTLISRGILPPLQPFPFPAKFHHQWLAEFWE